MTFQAVLVFLTFFIMLYLWFVNRKLGDELRELEQRHRELQSTHSKTHDEWQAAQRNLRISDAEVDLREEEIWFLRTELEELKASPFQKLFNTKLPNKRHR